MLSRNLYYPLQAAAELLREFLWHIGIGQELYNHLNADFLPDLVLRRLHRLEILLLHFLMPTLAKRP